MAALAVSATPALAQPACDLSPAQVFRAAAPSVVSVLAVSIDPQNLADRTQTVVGAGIVLDDAGHVLTNSHVVFGSHTIAVTTSGQDVVSAEMVGADPILDLAVLRLAGTPNGLTAAAFGDSTALAVGEEVLAIGNAFGLGVAVTRGIVSGLDRVIRRTPMSWLAPLIQTDAAINSGSSGGPLVNMCGEVVGINTFRLPESAGVGFAVPAHIAVEAVPALIEHGRIERPWHGINGKMVALPLQVLLRVPLVRGFLVETVEPGSAADRIGLRGGSFPVTLGSDEYLLGGDIITEVNGQAITDLPTAIRIVKSLAVGQTVSIQYFREGALIAAEVMLPPRPILPGDVNAVGARRAHYQGAIGAAPVTPRFPDPALNGLDPPSSPPGPRQ